MISKPMITVLMAEYNTNEAYLIQAILSIINQTLKDFELIIIDDHGENDIDHIVSGFADDRIRIVKNTENMGLVYSLNRGIEKAKGKYIARMDTDDLAMPNRIEKLYEFIKLHPEYAVVGSRVIEFSDNGAVGLIGKEGEKTNKSIMRGDVPIHPSTIMHAETLRSIGVYDNYNRAEDLALWCKLLINGHRIYVMDDVLLQYRVNSRDYDKRRLRNRIGEIKARLIYYPQMRAGLLDYLYILKSIIAGVIPKPLVMKYRKKYVLSQDKFSGIDQVRGDIR